jgi:peptide/nickel transport system substrate-binding protein
VRADPVSGLFGLLMVGNSPLLADMTVRAAIDAAVDRAKLSEAFNLQGWTIADRIVPAQMDLPTAPTLASWAGQDMEVRRSRAQAVIESWKARNGAPPALRLALPAGEGSRLLYYRLAADLSRIGLSLTLQTSAQDADLILIDEVAPFDSAHWYLSRLACRTGPGCRADALDRLAAARAADDPAMRARLLDEAEGLVVGQGNFVPLGLPIRWSLVSRRLTAFQPSPRGVHPLNQLLPLPN